MRESFFCVRGAQFSPVFSFLRLSSPVHITATVSQLTICRPWRRAISRPSRTRLKFSRSCRLVIFRCVPLVFGGFGFFCWSRSKVGNFQLGAPVPLQSSFPPTIPHQMRSVTMRIKRQSAHNALPPRIPHKVRFIS